MNTIRLLPLLILFALLACSIPVQEQTAVPAAESTVYLPRLTTTVQEIEVATETPQPTATLVPETAVPQSTNTPVPDTATPQPTGTAIPDTPAPEPTDAVNADTPTPEPTDTAIPNTSTPEPTDTPVPPAAAGFACFGTQDGGLACVSAAGDWITPPENGIIRAITACPDQIVIAGNELLLFDGEQFASQTTPFAPTHISCADDDALWIASDDALAVFVDGNWASHAGAPTTPIRSLAAVDGDEAWTSSALTVDRLEDGEWTAYKALDGFDDTYLFEQVVTAGDGNVWAVATDTIFRFSGRRWINPFSEPWPPLSTVAFDFSAPTIGTLYDGVLGGSNPGSPISALAYDESGRLHIGTPIGMTVGDITYTPATSPLTHPHITHIAVVNSPTYPAPQTKQTGAVIGRIVDSDGNGVVTSSIMLCNRPPRRFYSHFGTPCDYSSSSIMVLPDPDGSFRFDAIPPNTYHIVYTMPSIVVETVGEWIELSEAITVTEGETVDVGRLTRK